MIDAPPPFNPASLLGRGRSGHIVALGADYVAHGEDWCELALPYDRRLISDLATGVLASGPIVSIMDSAAGMAICLKRGKLQAHATLDLRIDYLRPARPGQTVHGRCRCYRLTRRVGFVEGVAHDGDPDDPIARVAGSFLLDNGPALSVPA
ncbi:PaaI family thioesterase [Sphingomonas sp. BIUV-7]|uniref:PaaI family thioesterase n=1 Tax=Sphingomonas natans TaxID=3063330 RepID=A0ABT8YEK9_9SPHN|nr:PaaI family thioesterase [Sphingomonas sp. BIUV-7]MDO6416770.1 PaaI family thioesterase [Sphingomonas sp. BIUV-7]